MLQKYTKVNIRGCKVYERELYYDCWFTKENFAIEYRNSSIACKFIFVNTFMQNGGFYVSLSWQAEVWAGMKDNNISRAEIASELGFTPEYVSQVLNKKKTPVEAEQKFRNALISLISRRKEDEGK